jgi:hypothetical protein
VVKNPEINWCLKKIWELWKNLEEVDLMLWYIAEHEEQGLRLILNRIRRELMDVKHDLLTISDRVELETRKYESIIEKQGEVKADAQESTKKD